MIYIYMVYRYIWCIYGVHIVYILALGTCYMVLATWYLVPGSYSRELPKVAARLGIYQQSRKTTKREKTKHYVRTTRGPWKLQFATRKQSSSNNTTHLHC